MDFTVVLDIPNLEKSPRRNDAIIAIAIDDIHVDYTEAEAVPVNS